MRRVASTCSTKCGASKGSCESGRRASGKANSGPLCGSLRMDPHPPFEQAIARHAQPPIDHRIAASARGLQASRGVLRNHRQGQRFGKVQGRRRLAEVGKARRAHAFHVAPIGRVVEIRLEDVVLGVAQLQHHGGPRLVQFAARRTRVEPVHQPSQLHGDGGAALRVAMANVGHPCAARQAPDVDARMPAEPAVLVQQHAFDHGRRNVLQRHPQAIALVAGQASGAADDHRGHRRPSMKAAIGEADRAATAGTRRERHRPATRPPGRCANGEDAGVSSNFIAGLGGQGIALTPGTPRITPICFARRRWSRHRPSVPARCGRTAIHHRPAARCSGRRWWP